MNSNFFEFAKKTLEPYYERLLRCHNDQQLSQLKFLWKFLKQAPSFTPIVDDIKSKHNPYYTAAHSYISNQHGQPLSENHLERVYVTYFIIELLIKDSSSPFLMSNLGAELFEADCSVVLDRILGNSLWLGAKHRGSSAPGGFSAFPVPNKKQGCIIGDSKFSQSKSVVMVKLNKNKNYIKSAKTNPSIKANGGLKAFVFISNNPFPKTYEKKYRPLINDNKIKVNFLQSSQLKLISDHYRHFEKGIQNNRAAKTQYVDLLKKYYYIRRKENGLR